MAGELHDIALALYDEVADLRRLSEQDRQCVVTALAVAVATALALALHADAVWWAAISGFVSTQATAPASIRRGILRVVGTATGALIGLFLSPWLVEDVVALSLALLVISTCGVLGLLVSGHGYAWLLGGVTADMVLLAALGDPLSTLAVACSRTAEVFIGTLSAIVLTLVLAPDLEAPPSAAAPGCSELLGTQWPSVRHALRAGAAVMLVPLVWSYFELPSLSQTAITAAAVMAVPTLTNDPVVDQHAVLGRALHRITGCFLGGILGLVCLTLSVISFLPWLLTLTIGIWIFARLQNSRRGIGYVGTQGAVAFISTLVQGWGPPVSILPGIERFVGIAGGLSILLLVTLITTPARPAALR